MLVAVSPLMSSIVQELRLKVAHLIGLNQYTLETMRQAALPFAVSVTAAKDYVGMDDVTVRAQDVDLVARFYIDSIMHHRSPRHRLVLPRRGGHHSRHRAQQAPDRPGTSRPESAATRPLPINIHSVGRSPAVASW